MNEREAWQRIGEAFEQYAETGEEVMVETSGVCVGFHQSLVSNGLCAARHRLFLADKIDSDSSFKMYEKIRNEVKQIPMSPYHDSLTLSQYGRAFAADRAMLCYLFATELEQETENAA